MKHLSACKNLYLLIIALLVNGLCLAQKTNWDDKSARQWFNDKGWAGGLKLKVHQPLNLTAFAKDYETNKASWDKAIAFLRDRNLEMMAVGKYAIDGENVYAVISESDGKDADSAAWEGHRRYADLHYVIKGREKIGVNERDILKVTKPYDETNDNENYYTNGRFYTADPGIFFIFLPCDIHQAGIKYGKNIKKLVVKIKVKPVE